MDRRLFIERAPQYYALALALGAVRLEKELFTETEVREELGRDDIRFRRRMGRRALANAGMHLLVEAGVIQVIKEDFGPNLYQRDPTLNWAWMFEGDGLKIPAFARYGQLQNLSWLAEALEDVDNKYQELQITEEDFEQPAPSFWEPLPLDRSDEQLLAATEKVDEAISKIEADNGYSVTLPGERDYVLQSLKSFSRTLKESAQITAMQIKTFALEPLNLVIKRFKGAALETVAGAAKDALVVWLKAKFGAVITWLLF